MKSGQTAIDIAPVVLHVGFPDQRFNLPLRHQAIRETRHDRVNDNPGCRGKMPDQVKGGFTTDRDTDSRWKNAAFLLILFE